MDRVGTEIEKQKIKTQQKRVSNAEVVNGVHPLHWATSLGPSPMGTDPINGFKMVHNVSGIYEHQLQQQNIMLYKTLKTPLFWKLQFSLQTTKKTKS